MKTDNKEPLTDNAKPRASFAGFLNQTQVSRAYVAADVLVLSSDFGETWGLVVNEAMASGLPCVVSDRCGCAPDLGNALFNKPFSCGNLRALADRLRILMLSSNRAQPGAPSLVPFSLSQTVSIVDSLHERLASEESKPDLNEQ